MSGIEVKMTGDTQVEARFKRLPEAVRAALVRKITMLTLKLQSKIIIEKLSGQVLKVGSGDLRRSIFTNGAKQDSGGVEGQVGSAGVSYARIHEYGGHTSAHIIEPKTIDGVLAFSVGGKTIFAKRVNHPGSNMPERSFMRSSLKEMRTEIQEGIKIAVKEGSQ